MSEIFVMVSVFLMCRFIVILLCCDGSCCSVSCYVFLFMCRPCVHSALRGARAMFPTIYICRWKHCKVLENQKGRMLWVWNIVLKIGCCWLVVLRINVDLAIFQPNLDLEAGDNQYLKIQVARPGIEPWSSCSASQELNHSATAAPLKIGCWVIAVRLLWT